MSFRRAAQRARRWLFAKRSEAEVRRSGHAPEARRRTAPSRGRGDRADPRGPSAWTASHQRYLPHRYRLPLACIEYLLKAEHIGFRPDWYVLVKAYLEARDESRVKAIADEQTDLVARTGLRVEAARARALLGDQKEASDVLVSCFNALAQSGSGVEDRTAGQLVSRIWHDFLPAGNYDAAVQAATARQDPSHRMEALFASAERLAESGQSNQALLALALADQTLRDDGRYAAARVG